MKITLAVLLVAFAVVIYQQPNADATRVLNCKNRSTNCRDCKDRSTKCRVCRDGFDLVNEHKLYWRCVAKDKQKPPKTPKPTCPPSTASSSCRIDTNSYSKPPSALGVDTAGPLCAINPKAMIGVIRLNGDPDVFANYCDDKANLGSSFPGVRLGKIDPNTCALIDDYLFETGTTADDATLLASNLTSAAAGTVFAGFSADDPSAFIANAKDALMSVCSVDLSTLATGGGFAFVCEVGNANRTTYQVAAQPNAAIASATISGTPGPNEIFTINPF